MGVNTIEINSILHAITTVEYRHANLAVGATLNLLGALLVGLFFGPGLTRGILVGVGFALIHGSAYFLRAYRVRLKSPSLGFNYLTISLFESPATRL